VVWQFFKPGLIGATRGARDLALPKIALINLDLSLL